MSDKFKPEGFENIPTPERVSEEMRGATSQDGQSPGKDGGKVGQKAENSEPSIGDSEPDPADNGERSTKAEEKTNVSEARAAAAEAAHDELRAKMLALENQIYRISRDAESAKIQNERRVTWERFFANHKPSTDPNRPP